MQVLIVEDEFAAREKLIHMLTTLNPKISVTGQAETVVEALEWIKNNSAPDLAFFDVQLADDFSFQIVEVVDVDFPVIFTTAYDEYVLKALEHNSVDYLLKPITKERLSMALDKVKKLESHFVYRNLKELIRPKELKKRFLVKKGIDLFQ